MVTFLIGYICPAQVNNDQKALPADGYVMVYLKRDNGISLAPGTLTNAHGRLI